MNAPALFSDGSPVNPTFPVRTIWTVDWRKYGAETAFEARWQVQLAAIRAENEALLLAKARARLAKYAQPKAKKQTTKPKQQKKLKKVA